MAAKPQDRLHQVPDDATPALHTVITDFIRLPGAPGTLNFYGPSTPQYRAFVAGEPAVLEPEVLGVTRSHTFRLIVAGGGADLAVRAASVMQDDVMDELGAPWPELAVPSKAKAIVLQPRVSSSGEAQWQGGEFTCPMGELHKTFGHLIRRT